jgi:hypothetical protein
MKNVEKYGTDWTHTTKWSMRFACWKIKVTDTHSEYVILISFPPQQWLQEWLQESTSILFLVNDQRDAQILFYVFISVHNSLHVSSTQCSSSGETNCINAASGNSHSMLVAEMCAGWKT